MSTTGQKSRINHIFNVLKKILLCLPRLMEKISNIVKSLLQFQITVFHLSMLSNVLYFCDAQLYFQHHYSNLQCHIIFINHNNMLICCSIISY